MLWIIWENDEGAVWLATCDVRPDETVCGPYTDSTINRLRLVDICQRYNGWDRETQAVERLVSMLVGA